MGPLYPAAFHRVVCCYFRFWSFGRGVCVCWQKIGGGRVSFSGRPNTNQLAAIIFNLQVDQKKTPTFRLICQPMNNENPRI